MSKKERAISVKTPDQIKAELEEKASDVCSLSTDIQQARLEEEELDSEQYYQIQLLKAQVEKFKDDNTSRRNFASSIFCVTVVWMFFVLLIIYGSGVNTLQISDTVLIALITTTTANVAGFLYVVVNYLFNKEKST